MVPIVEVQCKYRQSARFDDVYEIQTTLKACSRVMIQFSYRILRKADGVLLAEGTSKNAFVNLEGKVTRLTPDYYEKLQQLAAQEREIQP